VNQFKIYKSSAGSGKTFTLVKEYLKACACKTSEYRHILALTFTNKATEEMKSRILERLVELSQPVTQSSAFSPQSLAFRETLISECGLTHDVLTKNARRALDHILHDYSNFSISTIDSFFNRIIRSLAKEIQLPLRLDIQLDAMKRRQSLAASCLMN